MVFSNIIGVSMGSVTFQNWAKEPAPSREEAS